MRILTMATGILTAMALSLPASASEVCEGFGPQTPRDIAQADGENAQLFPFAPASAEMNLCNIHTHTNAEHKGPGFSVFAGAGEHGGFKCNDTEDLTERELSLPEDAIEGFHGVKPGDTIEVHWVFTSCDVKPGPTLGACSSDGCANPTLRVESQVFLVVNDDSALDFASFVYGGNMVNDRPQPKAIPSDTGSPVVFRGSTTGPKYTEAVCSPLQVTWSVRPNCAKLSYNSLQHWGRNGNVFDEDHSHGVRQLVTAAKLLAPIR